MPDIPSSPASFQNARGGVNHPTTNVTFAIPNPSPGKRWTSGSVEIVHTVSGSPGFWQDLAVLGGLSFAFLGPDGFGYHNHLGEFDESLPFSPDGWSGSNQPGTILQIINAAAGGTLSGSLTLQLGGFFSLTDDIDSFVIHLDEGDPPVTGGETVCPQCAQCGAINTGESATICAGTEYVFNPGAVEGTGAGEWWITELPVGGQVASRANPNGWTVANHGGCSLDISAPCGIDLPGRSTTVSVLYYTGHIHTVGSNVYSVALKNCLVVTTVVVCDETGPPDTTATGRGISYDVSDAFRHARSYLSGSNLKIGFASDVVPLHWEDRDSGMTASDACLRYDRQSEGSALYAFLCVNGRIVFRKTTDEGATWSMAVDVLGGTHPAGDIGRDGRRFVYGVHQTGTGMSATYSVHGVILDSVNHVIEEEFTAVASCDDDDISAREFVTQAGKWYMGLFYRSGGTIKFVTATDGKTFS